jgi:hypothetical protein
MRDRRHRVLVWSLIGVASLLLIVSMTANWVQRTVLDSNEVANTSDEILADQDVQDALSIYLVDQLYATVDVQGQIEERLPDSAKALAVPVAAASRQLALDVSEKALASPRFQALVSTAIRDGHRQFVRLMRDRDGYISSTDGKVTLNYGDLLAELATRLGVDPETIDQIRQVVREASTNLKQGLTTVQTRLESARSEIDKVQGGTLDPQTRQTLESLESGAADLESKIAELNKTIEGAQEKVPAQLESRLAKFEGRLSDLEGRLNDLEERTAAVLEDPSQANTQELDSSLAPVEARVERLLGRPAIQNPGQIVLIDSDQLGAVQTVVRVLRNLGFVLPILVLILYVGAIYLASGWRRQALIAAGGGILVSMLLVLLIRRLTGNAVVDSLSGSETVEPAVRSVWDIVSGGLRERALFLIVVGVAFVGAGLLAGPGRPATSTRRFLAPYLREQPVLVYSVVAAFFILWLTFIPGIENLGQVIVVIALGVLAVVGVEALRRQTAEEFPERPGSS